MASSFTPRNELRARMVAQRPSDAEKVLMVLIHLGPGTVDDIDSRLRELGFSLPPQRLRSRIRSLWRRGYISPAAEGVWRATFSVNNGEVDGELANQ